MKRYNFDQIVDRKGTDSYKWDVQDNELPMWVADMDFAVLPEVVTAIKERLEIPAFGYCGVPKEYYEAYCSWWKRNHHVDLTIDDMTFSSGVVASIDSIFKHIVPKGSGVIIQTPVYHVFEHCIKNNGLKTINNQLLYDGRDYHINFDNLEQLMKDENNKLFLLCNPHNPVGRIWSEEELKKIVSLCEKYDVLLLSDEIHCDIAEPGYEYNSILKYSDKAIALFAPSKVFNLASLHCSCVVSKDHDLLKRIEEGLGQDDLGEPNYFGPYGTIAAFNHGDEWVKEMNEYVFNNKRYMNGAKKKFDHHNVSSTFNYDKNNSNIESIFTFEEKNVIKNYFIDDENYQNFINKINILEKSSIVKEKEMDMKIKIIDNKLKEREKELELLKKETKEKDNVIIALNIENKELKKNTNELISKINILTKTLNDLDQKNQLIMKKNEEIRNSIFNIDGIIEAKSKEGNTIPIVKEKNNKNKNNNLEETNRTKNDEKNKNSFNFTNSDEAGEDN